METSNRFKCVKQASMRPNIQNGESRSDKKLDLQSRMGSLCRSVLSYPYTSKVKKSSLIYVGGHLFQFRALPFGIAMAPLKFTRIAREVKIMLKTKAFAHTSI